MNLAHRVVCRSGPWRWVVRRRLVPWALDGLDLGDHALELGPGPGLTTDLIRARTARLTAAEVDPQLAASLRERTMARNVEVVRADATELPFPDGSFSAVEAEAWPTSSTVRVYNRGVHQLVHQPARNNGEQRLTPQR